MAVLPYTIPGWRYRLPTLRTQLENSQKKPFLGVTQGGSSRRHYRGARVAATDGEKQAERYGAQPKET